MTGAAGLPASIPVLSGQWTQSARPEAMATGNGDPARGGGPWRPLPHLAGRAAELGRPDRLVPRASERLIGRRPGDDNRLVLRRGHEPAHRRGVEGYRRRDFGAPIDITDAPPTRDPTRPTPRYPRPGLRGPFLRRSPLRQPGPGSRLGTLRLVPKSTRSTQPSRPAGQGTQCGTGGRGGPGTPRPRGHRRGPPEEAAGRVPRRR